MAETVEGCVTAVVFRPAALVDLDRIWRFVAVRDEQAANRITDRLRRSVRRLETFPLSAPARPDLGHNVRKLSAYGHVVLYRVDEHRIEILRVIDARRNFVSVFKNRRR